jgi:hypothetical protein
LENSEYIAPDGALEFFDLVGSTKMMPRWGWGLICRDCGTRKELAGMSKRAFNSPMQPNQPDRLSNQPFV